MNKVYFDVTDIVQYANSNSRVSGIQRVQARLIGSLARRVGGGKIRATFWHPTRNEMVDFDPSAVFNEAEFDSGKFLARLGLWRGGRMPARNEVRRYLAPYNNRKIKRGLLKIFVYAVAFLSVKKLKEMGIDTRPELDQEPRQILSPLHRLDLSDVYVFLGSNWSYPDILEFGRSHSEAGGVVVQMIYDLIPHVSPEYCGHDLVESFGQFLHRTPTYANRFACISEWTKKEFEEFLAGKNLVRSVTTVPLAHEFDGFVRNQIIDDADSADVKALKNCDFVICVGTIERRKNGVNLLRAWSELVQRRGKDRVPTLVFAGKLGWKLSEFTAILDSHKDLKGKVVILPTPSDKDLAFLYTHCHFSIYPSKYEGWGLPVGESAWFGKYVIASDATSLPEVCGDLIDYVNPDNVSDIVERVEYALDHPEHVAKREEELRSAKLRSWDEVADALFAVIEEPSRGLASVN